MNLIKSSWSRQLNALERSDSKGQNALPFSTAHFHLSKNVGKKATLLLRQNFIKKNRYR